MVWVIMGRQGVFSERRRSSCEIALKWMLQNTFDDKSTLVKVMAWCCQVTSHYQANVDPDLFRCVYLAQVTKFCSNFIDIFKINSPISSVPTKFCTWQDSTNFVVIESIFELWGYHFHQIWNSVELSFGGRAPVLKRWGFMTTRCLQAATCMCFKINKCSEQMEHIGHDFWVKYFSENNTLSWGIYICIKVSKGFAFRVHIWPLSNELLVNFLS